ESLLWQRRRLQPAAPGAGREVARAEARPGAGDWGRDDHHGQPRLPTPTASWIGRARLGGAGGAPARPAGGGLLGGRDGQAGRRNRRGDGWKMSGSRLSEGLRRELVGIVGAEQVHAGPAEKLAYSYDGTFQQHVPDVAVTPGCEAEVVELVRLAARERLPIV